MRQCHDTWKVFPKNGKENFFILYLVLFFSFYFYLFISFRFIFSSSRNECVVKFAKNNLMNTFGNVNFTFVDEIQSIFAFISVSLSSSLSLSLSVNPFIKCFKLQCHVPITTTNLNYNDDDDDFDDGTAKRVSFWS